MGAAKRGWVAYRVLWLLIMRHFPDLTDKLPRKDAKNLKLTHDKKRSLYMRYALTDLAFYLRYDSREICLLL